MQNVGGYANLIKIVFWDGTVFCLEGTDRVRFRTASAQGRGSRACSTAYFAVLKYRGSGGGWSLRVGIR
jgi:hypothetical protein